MEQKPEGSLRQLSLMKELAYVAPVAGVYLFYMPMWSILPGIYAKYFGLPLTSIATVVLIIRVFDGAIVPIAGYVSDWHRSRGGSRKSWVIAGSLGSIVACYFLYMPPQPVSTAYYLSWSLVYFLSFTIVEIPHVTWGNELTLNYQQRARVFAIRSVAMQLGTVTLYSLPLLPIYASSEYSPQILSDAVYLGAAMSALGLIWTVIAAPLGVDTVTARDDSVKLFLRSLVRNRPLLLYYAAFGVIGLCYGMWFGLLYFYIDSYLGHGERFAMMLLVSTILQGVATPLWLKLIEKTSKATTWAVGVVLFVGQLICAWFITPGTDWRIALVLVVVAHLCFACHGVAAVSILGDIVDYGKWRFRKDRGATYFGFNVLVFQVALGVGGASSIGAAGLFGFVPSQATNTAAAILGLKLGFVVAPIVLATLGLLFILRTPIDRRRHQIIQRRIESRLMRSSVGV